MLMLKKRAGRDKPPSATRRLGVNEAGYACPRFNLEGRRMAWLKKLRSAGSRATARALNGIPATRDAIQNYVPDRIIFSEYEIFLRDLPPELEGIRIAHLSDIHHGPWLPIDVVHSLVDRVNAEKPDFVALTGDYVVNSPQYIEPVAAALRRLKPTLGMAAVLGNHDWWEGGHELRRIFKQHGIPLIDNSRLFITPKRLIRKTATKGLCIAGVGDAWEDIVDFDKAFRGVSAGVPRILLSHNPDCAEDKRLFDGGHRVDLILSGHTHGGQVCLPKEQKPVLPRMRKTRYTKGLMKSPAGLIYVSRGIGTAGVPVRLNAPPDIALFELRSQRD